MNKKEYQNQNQSFLPSSDNYLVKNHILEYLNDSIQQLLEVKNTNPKVDVLEFFTEYFKSVKQGTHVLFREYNFISSTPHNRACFIEKFLETFHTMIEKEDSLKICDYHSLILLLCQDFPIDIIESSLKLYNPDNLTACFKDFIYAFQFQFYYKEFINEAKAIYDNLYLKSNLVSLDGEPIKFHSEKYLNQLENLKQKINFSVPPRTALKDALQLKENDFSFNDFLKVLSFHDSVTTTINKIPVKSQINEYKKPNMKTENESDGRTTEVDAKKEQSTVTSSEYSRMQKQGVTGKMTKKSISNKDVQSDNSRSTTSDSSSDSDT